ncbi:hypothetical protein ElyMa_004177400 [Elysia marginata]|uniref:Uncharacterized protein n=1 Tax=Elysia marginata TaxID=1093978 RepID=A0AAV4GKK2_9GAST|nr:hypothetical protein ElyMa_004177400 [Elysia marginata]
MYEGSGGATGSVNAVAVGGSIISLPRACALCGRGGNLHLSAADPNCRCQQDSVLITSFHNGAGVEDSKFSPDVDSGHVTHKSQASGKQRKAKMSQQRKAASVTPTRLGLMSITDGGEPHSPNTEPDADKEDYAPVKSARPLSASTVDQCLVPSPHRPNVHHRKLLRKSTVASVLSPSAHPPDSVFNPQQNLFHTQQPMPGPSKRHGPNLQGFISSWQALASSSGASSSVQELIYSPLHPLFHHQQRQMLLQPPSYRPIRLGNHSGFRGRMHAGGRITSIGGGGLREYHTTQKSGAHVASSVKLWTNLSIAEGHDQWLSPLSVVAQRRARLKQPK